MARRSAKEAAGEPEEVEMQITPLIDVVFLLLVFFITSIHFRTLEGFLQANIPEAAPPSGEPPEDNNVTIVLRDVGNQLALKVNTVEIQGSTIVELYDALAEHLAMVKKTFTDSNKTMPMVIIDAGVGLRYKYVVSALNVCGKLKIDNISFLMPESRIE